MKVIVRLCLCIMAALLLLPVLISGVLGNGSLSPSISSDGRFVAFDTYAALVHGDTNGMLDVFVRDRQTGTTTLVSKSSAGVPGDDYSGYPSISADGRYVAYYSLATTLVSGDTNSAADVFVRDRQTGTTWIVSKSSAGTEGDASSMNPSVSADGRYVAFESLATNLVAGDTNGFEDIFVRDRQTGSTWLVSKSSAGADGNADSYAPSISADGRYVAFESLATNLVAGDTNGFEDIFVRDRQTGSTWLVSKNSAGVQGNGASSSPVLSANGSYVTYNSLATNLGAGDTNGAFDVFVRDRQTGTNWLVSKNSAGVQGNGDSYDTTISSDGRYVAYESTASNLVAGDTNGAFDVFVRDRQTGTTWIVSKSSAGVEGNGMSMFPSLSSDGRYVAFESGATNLVPDDINGIDDVFVRDRQTGSTWLVSKS